MSTQNIDLDLQRWSDRWKNDPSNATEVKTAISSVLSRVSSDRGFVIDGYSATRILTDFLDNPDITNQQLIQISKLTQSSFQGHEDDLNDTKERYPDYATKPGHIVAIDLLHILTGLPKDWLSRTQSAAGFTGTQDLFFYYTDNPKLLLGTVIHDVTTILQIVGVTNLNGSVWKVLDTFGVSNITLSALVMAGEKLIDQVTDIIPDKEEILKIVAKEQLPIDEIALRGTVTRLGEVSSTLGAKLAIHFSDQSLASQIITQSAGETIGGWLGDAINYELVGSSLPAKALYTRLVSDFTMTAADTVQSAIAQAFNQAFDIDDPIAQIGINKVTSTLSEYAFSKLAIATFGKEFSSNYLGVNPNININLTPDVIIGNVIDLGFSSIQSFIGTQLFDYIDEVWEDVNLNNEGAAIGGILGGFIAPGIGNFLGQIIGGWVWDIAANEDPRAYYTVSFNRTANSFVNQFSFEEDDGRPEVAEQMSRSAKDTLQLIAGMIGGKVTQVKVYEYGHYEEEFIYKPSDSDRVSFSNAEEALQVGLVSQLKTVKFQGGDPYMKRVAALPAYNPSLQQLFADLGVAKEYSVHKADPILYGQMILNVEDETSRRFLLDDWRRIHTRANELTLNTVPGNGGSEFIASTVGNDSVNGGSGNDFLFGDTGDDVLDGGSGDDRLEGSEGSDTLRGGAGNDTIVPDDLGQVVYINVVDGGTGTDLLTLDYSSYKLFIGRSDTKTGIFNTQQGVIKNFWYANIDAGILLKHSNIERFNIIGTVNDDHLVARAGDILDGYDGKDKLNLDLADANRTAVIDLTQTNSQVVYGSTQVRNFETIGTITTGVGNDTIKLNVASSSEQGTVNGGAGSDQLTLDYSSYKLFIGRSDTKTGIFNTQQGVIKNFWYANIDAGILLKHSNIERFNIIGTVNDDRLTGQGDIDTLNGSSGNDTLTGGAGNDILLGGDGSDWLTGDAGNDVLTGGASSDRFIYSTIAAYTASAFGQDTITDLTTGTDKIVLDLTTFTAIRSAVGNGFSRASEFATVSSDGAVSTNAALIVYSSGSGRLFYNQNGSATGLGTGSNFATLRGNSALNASDFIIQS